MVPRISRANQAAQPKLLVRWSSLQIGSEGSLLLEDAPTLPFIRMNEETALVALFRSLADLNFRHMMLPGTISTDHH